MKVMTLIGGDFKGACRELAERVGAGFDPDVVVGILNGGAYVGRQMLGVLTPKDDRAYAEVRLQRSSTESKDNPIVSFLLRHLPLPVLDMLRKAEAVVLEHRLGKNPPRREGSIEFVDEISDVLAQGGKNVLIVDDAIDSGATIALVKEYISEKFPGNDVRTAVITVTTRHPIADADYWLYHDRVLIRFPWSKDAKEKKK